MRQDTFHGSYISLNESERRVIRRPTLSNTGTFTNTAPSLIGTSAIGHTLLTDDYFSNMNPRSMKRIVNSLTLTGRLMRAFEIDFSWLKLGHWVSLNEQWPYRMSWLIDRCIESRDLDENVPLFTVYEG